MEPGSEQPSVHETGEGSPSTESLQAAARDRRAELDRMIEAGEIRPQPFDVNGLQWIMELGEPVKRADLQNRAIVLTRTDLEDLGGLEILRANGESDWIDPETVVGDELIILPRDLWAPEPQAE